MYSVYFLETFILAFFAFFATVAPVNSMIIFMSMTGKYSAEERKKMAISAVMISSMILIFIMFLGAIVLQFLGISLAALKTAGGTLLLLTAIGMMFGQDKEGVSDDKVINKKDITVFPLAVPIIAGPGAISTSMIFVQKVNDVVLLKGAVFLALLLNLFLTLVLMLLSEKIITRIKKSVIEVFLRIAGLILASLAMQFIFDGLKDSNIFK